LKSQDILILLKLVSLQQSHSGMEPIEENTPRNGSARGLAALTGIGKSEVNASINRSVSVGLAKMSLTDRSMSVNKKSLFEFIVYGLKFVFPAKPAELTRGIPTAFAAPVLNKKLFSSGDNIPVWPDANASKMGQSIEPLYKSVTFAIENDKTLYGYLALVDAIRIGNARESNLAAEELSKMLKIR